MVIITLIFTLICISATSLFLTVTFLILKIFAGKSIADNSYPPIKGTVFNLILHYGRIYDHQTELAAESPTFRLLSPDTSEVFTTDTRNIEHVLKTRFESYSKGEHNRERAVDLFGQGIFVVDGDKWRHQRRLAGFEFSARFLRVFSCDVFRRNAAKLVRVVSQFSASNEAFDMQDLLMRCTLDSIFKVGFGVELNCLEGSNKEGLAFMKAFDESHGLLNWRYVDPLWKLKRFLNLGSEASLKKNIRVIDEFVHRLIRTRRKMLEERRDCNDKEDILSRFLVESEKDPEKMNDKYLRDIVLNFMIAGKDTSANTLSWFLYMLCKNPVVQEKVVQEARDVLRYKLDEANPDDFVENITDEVLDQMHYLHAALSETLRLYPAVPVGGRNADVDDILPDGFKVKKGDGVYYMAYSMGRMTNIWGEDARDFRPERWLKDGIFQPESPFKFIAFHAGPRICLGKDFAYRQMKIVAIALLHFFRFRLADETKPVTYRIMFTLHIKGALSLCAVPRTTIRS